MQGGGDWVPLDEACIVLDGSCYRPVVIPGYRDDDILVMEVDNDLAERIVVAVLVTYNTGPGAAAVRVRDMHDVIDALTGISVSQFRISRIMNKLAAQGLLVKGKRFYIRPDRVEELRRKYGVVPRVDVGKLLRGEYPRPLVSSRGVRSGFAVPCDQCSPGISR